MGFGTLDEPLKQNEKDMVNADKKIGEPFLNEKTGVDGKWLITFWYRDTTNKRKKFTIASILNKPPFVEKGVVSTLPSVVKKRKALADELLRTIKSKLETQNFNVDSGDFEVDSKDKSFLYYIDEYILSKKYEVSEGTFENYQGLKRRIEKYLIANNQKDIAIKHIDKIWVGKFLNFIAEDISVLSRNTYLVYLASVFKYSINMLDVDVINPTKYYKAIKVGRTNKHEAIQSNNLKEAFEMLKDFDMALYFHCKSIFYSLHRPSTLLSLQHKDFDFVNNRISISADIIKTKEKMFIHVAPEFMREIQDEVEKLGREIAPTEYFCGYTNRVNVNAQNHDIFGLFKTTSDIFRYKFENFRFERILKNCKIFSKNSTVYSWKHSGVVFLLESGFTPNEIITITGHQNVSILETYSKDFKPKLREFPSIG